MSPPAPPRPHLTAVLFDLDGTLVHTNIDFGGMKRAAHALAARYGADRASLSGMDLLALVDHVAEGLEDDTPFRAEIESLYLQYEGVAAACAEEVSGARDLLRDLRAAGMKLGIVTRNAPPGVKIILERVPLEHDVLLTRSDVPRVKPHPDHLLRAAALLDAPAVETLMVGDHRMDIQAGIAAGMPTVALLTEALGPEHFAALEPACTFDTLAELRAWLLR